MLVYLDTNIVIYDVKGQPPFQTRAVTHIAALQAQGCRFAISAMTRLECLVHPLGAGDGELLLDFERFFLAPNVTTLPLTAAVYERAARIRGSLTYPNRKRYAVPDALHLAAAVEAGC